MIVKMVKKNISRTFSGVVVGSVGSFPDSSLIWLIFLKIYRSLVSLGRYIPKYFTLLNNQQITEEIKKEIKICIETNENENTTTQNLWDTVKAVLKGESS